jgi:DNA-binding NarL/FixJ family response regulator
MESGKGEASILIVDDHPMMRSGMRELLDAEEDLRVAGEASDVATARSLLRSSRFDLALVDLSLGKGSGLDLVEEIASRYPDVRVLVVTMHDASLWAERALRAGALGFVNKAEPESTLLEAVRKVLAGETALDTKLTDRLVKRAVRGEPRGPAGVAGLSDRQLQVFELLGRGRSVRQIAEELGISVKTVETHRANIKTKLKVDSSAELLRQAVVWIEQNA